MKIRLTHRAALLAVVLGAAPAVASPDLPKPGAKLADTSADLAAPLAASAQAASQAAAAKAGSAAVEPGRDCPKIKVVYAGYGEAERAGCRVGTLSAAR